MNASKIYSSVFTLTSFLILNTFLSTAYSDGLMGLPQLLSGQELKQFDGLDLNSSSTDDNIHGGSRSFIDNSINPETYTIGMGDVFNITILELPSDNYVAAVNQQCDIYISELGLIKLGRITLQEALSTITEFVSLKFNKKYTVYVTLKEGKKASVSINGLVKNPGTYIVEGILRIQDCILKANKSVLPTLDTINLRDVVVERSDTVLHLDLYRYISTNDLSQNPYVYPGDRIFLKPPTERVYITGELINPQKFYFPIRPGETLSDLIPLLSFTGAIDLSHIIVQSGTSNKNRSTKIYSSENADQCTLTDMNIITFTPRSDYADRVIISLSGAVNRPGSYPVVRSQTTLEEIIDLAGGYKNNADSTNGYLIRTDKFIETSSTQKDHTVETVPLTTPGSIRPEINYSFSRLNNFRDYPIFPVSTYSSTISLENGDHIHIPFKDKFIYVSGCVSKPGAYPFSKGKKCKHYISLAGGYSSISDRQNTYILTRIESSLQIRSGHDVIPGDIIVVPDSQNNKTITTFILPLLQLVGTVATIVLTISALSKQ